MQSSVLNEKDDDLISVIKDLVSVVKNPKEQKKKKDSNYLGGSISKYSKNMVLTFPVLCDDTLSIETAQMISRVNEKNITTMLQLLFSSMSIKGNNGAEVLAQFHKNIENTSMDDIVNTLNSIAGTQESAIERARDREALKIMTESLKSIKTFPRESLNEKSLSDYLVRNYGNKTIVYEAPQVDPNIEAIKNRSAQRGAEAAYGQGEPKDQREEDKFQYQIYRDQEKDRRDDEKSARDEGKFQYQMYRDQEKDRRDDEKSARDSRRDKRDDQNDEINFASKQIVPQDVKKANELQPTLMVVKMNDVDENGNVVNKMTFYAGVKSRLIACTSMDIVERLVAKNKARLNFKNFLRATSGEIKWRDFLFCWDQAKVNARNAVKKGEAATMWNLLEKRSTKNNANKIRRSGNDASAITSLVINQETVNYINSTYRIDINSPKEAKKLMDEFNFLAIIICDESNEAARFLYDGNDNYELLSYSALSREVAEKNLKKEINLINKGR